MSKLNNIKPILKGVAIFAVAALIGYTVGMDIKRIAAELSHNMTVSYHGWLSTDGNKVVDKRGKEIQLKGVSTHGIQWFGDLYGYDDIKELKEWGVSVFRIAMYTDPDANGYVKNQALKTKVEELIDACIDLDMYVIVDWHILHDNNPLKYENEAKTFFDEISKKYANNANVIYELCNEPNGDVSWDEVRRYATNVLGVIRNNSPKSLAIVGSPNWSRDLAAVSNSPLDYGNVAYALHFYAGSDNKTLRDKIDEFRNKGLAVIVSECGITDSTGDGKIFADNFDTWINYLNDNKISWVFWSLSNKDESSSVLSPDYITAGNDMARNKFSDHLSETGEILKKYF